MVKIALYHYTKKLSVGIKTAHHMIIAKLMVISMGTQKKIGNNAEKRALEFLSESGWWGHLFAYNTSGQPCDIIAIKNDIPLLADVKHCETDMFTFSRIEPNQETCFQYAKECGITNTGFILAYDIQLYWLSYKTYKELQKVGIRQVTVFGLPTLAEQIRYIENACNN